MNPRTQLEAAIETAIDLGMVGAIIDEAIRLLDDVDGDPDLEDDEREGAGSVLLSDDSGNALRPFRYVEAHLDDEPDSLPPLMDGGGGYQLGRLPLYDQCSCCGHREHVGYVLPVTKYYDGQPQAVL